MFGQAGLHYCFTISVIKLLWLINTIFLQYWLNLFEICYNEYIQQCVQPEHIAYTKILMSEMIACLPFDMVVFN